jgi:hypothetical protein
LLKHVKNIIRKLLRPESEMTDILLELWNLAPKAAVPKESENYPFKTIQYNEEPSTVNSL